MASQLPPFALGAARVGGGSVDAGHASPPVPPAPNKPLHQRAAPFVNAPLAVTLAGSGALSLSSGKLGGTLGNTLGAHVVTAGGTLGNTLGAHVVTAGGTLGSSFGDRFIVGCGLGCGLLAVATYLAAKK